MIFVAIGARIVLPRPRCTHTHTHNTLTQSPTYYLSINIHKFQYKYTMKNIHSNAHLFMCITQRVNQIAIVTFPYQLSNLFYSSSYRTYQRSIDRRCRWIKGDCKFASHNNMINTPPVCQLHCTANIIFRKQFIELLINAFLYRYCWCRLVWLVSCRFGNICLFSRLLSQPPNRRQTLLMLVLLCLLLLLLLLFLNDNNCGWLVVYLRQRCLWS